MYSRTCLVSLALALALSAEEQKPKPTSRPETFAKNGQVDRLVAALAASDYKADDDRLWAPAVALGAKALQRAFERGELPKRQPPQGAAKIGTLALYRKALNPEFVRSDKPYTRAKLDGAGKRICLYQVAVLAPHVGAEDSLSGLVITPGPVTLDGGIADSLVLTNGAVNAFGVSMSVVVCDGDVNLKGAQYSLIVARGNIKVDEAVSCTFIASGTVSIKKVPPVPLPQADLNVPAILDGYKAELADYELFKKVWYEEKNANPLKFITFFELHRVGIEAKVEGGALVLSAVKGDSVAGRAGLKSGDVVLSAAGAKPADPEALRRALRDALAVGDAKVQVRRAGATVEAKFALPE